MWGCNMHVYAQKVRLDCRMLWVLELLIGNLSRSADLSHGSNMFHSVLRSTPFHSVPRRRGKSGSLSSGPQRRLLGLELWNAGTARHGAGGSSGSWRPLAPLPRVTCWAWAPGP